MVELFDTHCHLHELSDPAMPLYAKWLVDKNNSRSVESVIAASYEAGVTRLLCIGTSLEDSQLAVDFADKHENVWAAIAIHPHDAGRYVTTGRHSQVRADVVAAFEQLAERPKVVAVGECGLDYYYNHSTPEDQEAVLRFQLELALARNLPFSFHVRNAFDDFWRILADYQDVHGSVHSFTDTRGNMDRALSRGLFIGVNGIATFTKDPAQLDTYRHVPLDRLLFETDAPFLTPSPHRGTVCEPKHVRNIAEFMAGLQEVALEDIAKISTANARVLFKV